MLNGLTTTNGLMTGNGLTVNNGLKTNNGMAASNGVATKNGVKTKNGLEAKNGVQSQNGVAVNNGVQIENGVAASNGVTASNGVAASNGVTASNGVQAQNGVSVNNGVAVSNGVTVSNGIVAKNGVTVSNGVTTNNGVVSQNGVTSSNGVTVKNGVVELRTASPAQNGVAASNGIEAVNETSLQLVRGEDRMKAESAFEGQPLTLGCDAGKVITSVWFASYGTPDGLVEDSSCHAPTSRSVLSALCLGQNSCTVAADNATFGDPCVGQPKWLNAEVVCSLPVDTTSDLPVDCTMAGGAVGKPGKDCWGYPDGFANPDNGGLLSESQNVTVNADGSRTVHDLGIKLMKYMAKCALPAGDKISLLDYTGSVVQFSGSLGLAPQWKTEWLLRRRAPAGQGHVPAERQCVSHGPDERRGRDHAARAVFHEERSRRRPRQPHIRTRRAPSTATCSATLL